MEQTVLEPEELAKRWGVTTGTLSQWRWSGKGPLYIKIGRHISYLLQDVEQFEISKRRRSTSEYNSKSLGVLDQEHLPQVHRLLQKRG